MNSVRAWAKRIKRDAITLWFALQHPNTPWCAKVLGAFVVAYALSPIDLIPDFVPVLGFLDDFVLLPGLIWLTVRLLPAHVLAASRLEAESWLARSLSKPRSATGAIVIVLVWIVVAVVSVQWIMAAMGK
jgi:uncharacterized membrane protein YkvA (DUF1232 family)